MTKGSARKQVTKKEEVSSWTYILLLTAVAILGWVLGNFDFNIGKASLTVAIFVYPLRYFVANIITKKYGYKETMNGISYSACLMLLFIIVVSLLAQKDIDYIPVTGEVFAYLASQMINLTLYYYLFMNTDNNKLAILATYVFAMLVDNLISMLFISRMVMVDAFWRTYFVTILIEVIISIILINFDNKKITGPSSKRRRK
ncbi:MAG TPA: VUT family protein [Candidatus Onthousia faecavium]|nr:VUT family protein [Candidatus Onthousia faecavium]